MTKRVVYHGEKFNPIAFKTIKLIQKAFYASVGASYKIHEDVSDIAKIMKSKKGKLALKKIASVGTAIFTVAGMAVSIGEISKNIPEVSAAEAPTESSSIIQEAGGLDLNQKYGQYDINTETLYTDRENGIDNNVIILHNADGSNYSQTILTATGQKLLDDGIDYIYVNNSNELIEELQNINNIGKIANIISIENGNNNNSQTLIASSYTAGKTNDSPETPSETLARNIVSKDPIRLYQANGVASNMVTGERGPSISQSIITNENVERNRNGETLLHVETSLTIRPSSVDPLSPDQLAGVIVDGFMQYNNSKAGTNNNVHRL